MTLAAALSMLLSLVHFDFCMRFAELYALPEGTCRGFKDLIWGS